MLFDYLKTHTADLHRQTEAAFNLPHACESTSNYATLLRTLLGVYRPLEARLDRLDWSRAGIDWPSRRKTALIEKDLSVLNASDVVDPHAGVQSIDLADLPAAIGCIYVIEGSTLGAQFICKHIARTLKLTPDTGAAFFTGYGEATREQWNTLKDAANAFVADDAAATDRALSASTATFRCFEQAFRAAHQGTPTSR